MKIQLRLYLFLTLSLVFAGPAPSIANEAKKLFNETRQNAERGDPASQFALGNMYAQGAGAEQSYVKAHVWFNLAAAADHEEARGSRDVFSQLMTPEQIAEAQKIARAWYADHKNGEK